MNRLCAGVASNLWLPRNNFSSVPNCVITNLLEYCEDIRKFNVFAFHPYFYDHKIITVTAIWKPSNQRPLVFRFTLLRNIDVFLFESGMTPKSSLLPTHINFRSHKELRTTKEIHCWEENKNSLSNNLKTHGSFSEWEEHSWMC
jgi:hypothetical protein